jgi:hypothetical protein
MTIRIQKFEKYYLEIPSIYSSSGCVLIWVVFVCIKLEVPETQGVGVMKKNI